MSDDAMDDGNEMEGGAVAVRPVVTGPLYDAAAEARRAAVRYVLDVEAPEKALAVLLRYLEDAEMDNTLAGRKVKADIAQKLLLRGGFDGDGAGKSGQDDRPLSEYSTGELEKIVADLKAERAAAARPIIETDSSEDQV